MRVGSISPEANLRTLARRASLVLTGLPPSPESVEALVLSKDPYAFNSYVDQLLQSEGFGEHRARYWLDAVRYGDTSGLARDVRRGLYPYRDWVIQAFNDNLPMDQFITWQLAGDLLPEPSLEQRVATGYVRMNPTTNEGGSIPEEFQAKNNFDRVENLGTVFLGLSLHATVATPTSTIPSVRRSISSSLRFSTIPLRSRSMVIDTTFRLLRRPRETSRTGNGTKS